MLFTHCSLVKTRKQEIRNKKRQNLSEQAGHLSSLLKLSIRSIIMWWIMSNDSMKVLKLIYLQFSSFVAES